MTTATGITLVVALVVTAVLCPFVVNGSRTGPLRIRLRQAGRLAWLVFFLSLLADVLNIGG